MIYLGSDFIGESYSVGSIHSSIATDISYINVISQTSGASQGAFNNAGAQYRGQVFTAPSNGNFGRLGAQMWKVGSPTGVYTFELWSFDGTNPVAKIADGSNTLDVSTLPSSDPSSINVYFNCPTTALTSSSQYLAAIISPGGGSDGSNYPAIKLSLSNVYAGGAWMAYTGGVTTSQTVDGSGRDHVFTIDYIS